MSGENFPTVGSIAKRFGVQVHQVLHVIRSREIQSAGRAGAAHVYAEADVQRIGVELQRIAEHRLASTAVPSVASTAAL